MKPSEKILAHIIAALMTRISQERGGSTVLPIELTVIVCEAPGQPEYSLCTVSVGQGFREPCMRALREAGAIGVTDYPAGGGWIGVRGHFPLPAGGTR